MASLGDMFITVGAKIDGFERAMGTVGQRLRAIDRDVNKTFGGFAKIGDKLSSLGQSMTVGLTLPLAAAGAAATKMAADFDLGIRKVGSLVGGFTDKEMKALEDQTLAVSRALGIDAVKATDALYEAISAGVPKDNAVDFLAVASKAAIAGVTETKVAVDGLTSVINAYQLKTSDAKNVSDQMFQAVNIGKFTFEQLAASISIAVPLASQMGIDFGQVAGAAATLTSQGFSVSEAMTSVRSAMVAILTPNKAMNALFAEAGVTSGEALLKTKGFQGALETLREASKGNNQVLTEAYGRVEALGAALGLTGDKAAKARQDLDSVRHASDGVGAATAAYNEINKSATRQWEMAVAQIKATAIELGISLLPSISALLKSSQPLIQFLADVVKWFTALPEPVQTFALGLTAAVAVIGPLTLALGTMITGLSGAASAFVSLGNLALSVATGEGIKGLGGAIKTLGGLVSTDFTTAMAMGERAITKFGAASGIAVAGFVAWEGLNEIATNAKNLHAELGGLYEIVNSLADAYINLAIKALSPLIGNMEAWKKLLGPIVSLVGQLDLSTLNLKTRLHVLSVPLGVVRDLLNAAAKAMAALNGKTYDTIDVSSELKKSFETTEKAMRDAAKAANAYEKTGDRVNKTTFSGVKANKDLKTAVNESAVAHEAAGRIIRQFQDGIPSAIVSDYERRLLAAKRAIAESTIEHKLAILAGRDFESQLNSNIAAAQKLTAELADAARVKMPAYVAGLGNIKDASRGLTEDLSAAVEQGKNQFGILTDSAKKAAKDAADTKGEWTALGRDISTVFTNTAQSIAKDFFDGNLSVGEKFKKMAVDMGEAVLARFIEPATKAIGNFISGVIADLLGGKGFGGILGALKDLGEAMGKVFGIGGSAASAAGTAGSAAGSVGGAAGSAAGSAGQVAGAGISAVVGAIGSIASAVSGIIGNFQMAGMNKTLDLLENYMRYIKIWTGEQSQSILWCVQKMTERSGYMTATLDSIASFASEQLGWLARIGAVLEAGASGGPGSIVNNGGVAVSINNVTFGSRADIDYLIEQIAIRMRETGQTI